MESPETEFNYEDLLIGDQDSLDELTINITVTEEETEDGEGAVTLLLETTGLSKQGILMMLQFAYLTAEQLDEDGINDWEDDSDNL